MTFYKETVFQDSPMGKIPKDWRIATIGEMAKTEAGGTPSTFKKEYWGGDVPWINSGELKNDIVDKPTTYITKLGLESSAAKLLPQNTVLIALTGATTGIVGYLAFECSTNQSIVGILPNNDVFVSKFLFYYLAHSRKRILTQNVGSAQPHINKNIVESFQIALPSISEQKCIAGVFGVVDSAILKVDEVIAQTERLKKGLMQELLNKGIGHREYKDTPIGKIPREWEVKRLRDITNIERGKFAHRPRNEPRFYGGKIPFIQTGDIAKAKGLIRNYSQTLNEEGLRISKLFKKGTIVVSIAGNIGDVGILNFDSCFPDSVVGISVQDGIDAFFLMYMLQNRQYELSAKAPRSTQKNINLEIIGSLNIPIPPIYEQRKIAVMLSNLNTKLELGRKGKTKLERIKQGLMDLLLTGKVRVKVD